MTQFALVRIISEDGIEWSSFADKYLTYVRAMHSKATVIYGDRPAMKSFGKFLDSNPKISEITQEIALKYVGYLKDRMRPHSARVRLAVIVKMFKWAMEEGLISLTPFRGIRIKECQPDVGRSLSDKEIDILFSQIPRIEKRACELDLCTGMRRSEITELRWEWIDLSLMRDKQIAFIKIPPEFTKAKRERVIPLCYKALAALGPPKMGGSVFGITNLELNRAMTAAWKSAGVGRIRFHDLRHTAATRWYKKNKDLFSMMLIFGWSCTTTPLKYQHRSIAELQQTMDLGYTF